MIQLKAMVDRQKHVWIRIKARHPKIRDRIEFRDIKVLKDKIITLEDWQTTKDVSQKIQFGLLKEVKGSSKNKF